MKSSQSVQSVFSSLFSSIGEPSFKVKYWDGAEQKFGHGQEVFKLMVNNPTALLRALRTPSLGFGEAYMESEIDLAGDLRQIVRLANCLPKTIPALKDLFSILFLLFSQGGKVNQAKQNIAHHYDLGNDFYGSWLDKNLSYSCAYFRKPEYTLDEAQVAKVDYICKKLNLKKGETLLDVGCGWGHLIFHAVKNYGVKAHGITLSENQLSFVKEKIENQGLAEHCTVALDDYRSVKGEYDKIVSVGMFEHVGKKYISDYFFKTDRLLKPGGTTVLHTIGRLDRGVSDPWLRKYIFPGSYLPSLTEIVKAAQKTSLELTDFENLKFHYARTLDCWLENFEKTKDRFQAKFDDRFLRMWRLYLAACAGTFYWGKNHLFQLVFTKGWPAQKPQTREGWYLVKS